MQIIRYNYIVLSPTNKMEVTMAILITGAAGYVGSHTTYALSKAGYDLVAVDNLSTGFREALPANIRFYQGDIRDKFFLERLFTSEKIDGVEVEQYRYENTTYAIWEQNGFTFSYVYTDSKAIDVASIIQQFA